MSKDKISDYSATANSNTDIAGINIDEGCAPSGINNAIRTLMKQIKDLYAGTSGDKWPITAGGTNATTAADARTNLGLAIGTDVQAYNAALASIATNNGTNAMKNRIINGAMMIDQRNAGASVTPTNGAYTLDRWGVAASAASKFTVQQSSTAPAGFTKSLLVTSSSAYTVGAAEIFGVQQSIEGLNMPDVGFGAVGASTLTLSFWVRSSLTGTFGGVLTNYANNRTYPFSYTISSANTFEQKTITIAGDTSGTWLTTNSGWGQVWFGLGVGSTYSGAANSWAGSAYYSATGATSVVGTNGATFYITGVQLEKGSTATSFDYRPYGTELALCQRYYHAGNATMYGYTTSTNAIAYQNTFPTPMRIAPTITPTFAYFNASSGSVGSITTQSALFQATASSTNVMTFTGTYTATAEL